MVISFPEAHVPLDQRVESCMMKSYVSHAITNIVKLETALQDCNQLLSQSVIYLLLNL